MRTHSHQAAVALLLLQLLTAVEGTYSAGQKDYETFFNRGQKSDSKSTRDKQAVKSKVDVLGAVLKRHVEALRKTPNKQVELVFLVDSSASVGAENFFNELKFVKKLLADFTVEYNATRVAVITFSSRNRVVKHVDHVSEPSPDNHKCSLLEEQLPTITYQGGGTYTLGAVLQAQEVLDKARPEASKAVFLVTDGYSNGGDPRPAAKALREQSVEIFTFGIQNGNVRELYDMASDPPEEHSYILDSFEEFEALARRALHEDLHIGTYLKQHPDSCSNLCVLGENCCDPKAECTCGTHTGYYACICEKGFYGTGLRGDCQPCPAGTYKPTSGPGDESSCLPCPDVNHISYPASTTLDHCRCKPGFRKENHKCVAMACPVLLPPANGFFVNEDCTNDINVACGIRCDTGYQLKGTSVRVCSENGTWSGDEATCEMKTCPALSPPRHGSMDCSTTNNVFESECHFSCDPGFHLVGSKKRTCLAIALWDGLPALCRPVTCAAMEPLENGKVSPAKCTNTKSSFGDKCTFECNPGFKLTGPEYHQCADSGTWSEAQNTTSCLDVEAPMIKCPEDVVMDADENEANALVRWSEPITTDNSEDPVVVTVVPAIVSPRRFDIGTASILYTARDRAGNSASCNFTVTIRDVQPPTVDRCISPPVFLSRVLPIEVSWEEPMFSDNSGRPLSVVSSHSNPGYFPLGSTDVIYEVKDETGNNNTCIITITVHEHACAFPPNPMHGQTNCSEAENGVYCSLTCDDGYGFAMKTPQFYFCAYDGLWEPAESLPFPDCSFMFYSNSISKVGTVSVVANGLSCEDNFLLAQLEKHLERKISNRVSRICRNKIICEVENMIAECEYSKVLEESNLIYRRKRHVAQSWSVPRSRKRRSLAGNATSLDYEPRSMMGDSRDMPFAGIGGVDRRTHVVSAMNHVAHRAPLNKIELEFQLTGKLPENSEERAEQNSLLDNLEIAMNSLEDAAHRGELDLSLGNNRLQVKYVKFNREQPHFICEAGTVAQDNICVKCPVGTYFNVVSETCEACPLGTYQFLEGQFSCLVCPERTSTTTGQSKSLGECKAQCLPGTFSLTGLEPCETCAVGFYQPMYAQFLCLPCPISKTTHRRGVRSVMECKVPCPPGRVSRIGLEPCFPCPDGYFQPHEGAHSCFRCPEGLRTGMQGATNISACNGVSLEALLRKPMPQAAELTINDCFSVPCHHGASCKALEIGFLCICAPGYTGIYCESEVDECEGDPCKNGGTCKDHVNGFTCFCPVGYSGELCEEDVNDCLHEPCFNGATCVDEINGYNCICPAGFVGPLCQYNIDECLSNPCRNGGFCHDLVASYVCECMPGFEGKNCEINIDECEMQPCQNNATCVDDVLFFTCECLPGFEGHLCEIDIDECRPEPCMNGATCADRKGSPGFTCLCPPSYVGDLCETEMSSDFLLQFSSSGILDFVQLDALPRPLSAATVCMWMQTSDKVNYGTPISYADDGADNLLTLTDYSGFVFYVNMEKVVTDVTANDGHWHHICVTWSSANGEWAFYKDGQKRDGGSGLAIGSTIPATGTIVLGQEQDRRGAGFSTPESFIGTLTLLNIWDHVLDAEAISAFSTRCDNYRGNVRSWADFRVGIRGKVQLTESHFCSGCVHPENFPSGDITVSGVKTLAMASYACNPGYEMHGMASRRCLASGEWSGAAPQCARISCGFPGYIANGYINGRQYFFQDGVQYVCNPGYRLTGTATRTCQADKRWSGKAPHCEEIVCESPVAIGNGEVIATQKYYRLGHRIQLACEDGYRLDGPSSLTCASDGQWNDTLPMCQPRSCESPPRVPHGHLIGSHTNLHVGSIVRYKCDEGFKMHQSGEMYCELKNRWAGELPRCERISCGSPQTIRHGSFEGKDHKFGGMVIYKCNRGYELFGASSSVCQADGAWSQGPPECLPISCGALEPPEQGRVDAAEKTYGSVAKYSCHTGYELQGVRSRKCRETGEWSGETPNCVPVSCSQPESISNGRYSGSDWTVGNTVSYKCNPGYTLVGEADRVCLETGHWLHQVPSCEPVECTIPAEILHGSVSFDGKKFGQRAYYSCEVGYQLVGHAIRVCMEDKQWEPDEPECKPVSCGPPIQVENLQVTAATHVYGSVATYSCMEGFRLEGPATRKCQANGRWSGRDPSCEVIRCPDPLSVPHAYLINSDTRYGSVVEYYCDEGYKLQGPIQRMCNGQGQWAGKEPSCVRVQCPLPSSLINGDTAARDLLYGSVAVYSCHQGYELKGPSKRTCLQDETWSGADPFCVAIRCSMDTLAIDHGRVIGDSNVAGSTIQYECDVGYYLIGDVTRVCQDDRTWSNQAPTCHKVQCPVPRVPPNMDAVWNGHSFKDTISYTCFDGYTMVGDSLRSCTPDGIWSKSEPSCIPVECEKPNNPKHGKVIAESRTYGSYAEYRCDYGYRLKGPKKRACRADRTWADKEPKCQLITCPEPPAIAFGHVQESPETYAIGAEPNYKCDRGFIMHQSKSPLTCDAHGKWSGRPPTCKIVQCPTPPALRFGFVEGVNFTYNNVLHFSCNEGWRLIGERSLVCQSDGQWSGPFPFCVGILCPPPEHVPNGFVSPNNFSNGAIIKYSCAKGYEIIGTIELKCQNDNTWSGYPPRCQPVVCNPPRNISHGKITGDIYEYGSTVVYECDRGYELHGAKQLTCTEDRIWDAEPPVCEQISCPLPDQLLRGEVVVHSYSQGGTGRNVQVWPLMLPRGDITVDGKAMLDSSRSDIFHLGDKVTYRCTSGYKLVGESVRTCQENGSWSGDVPKCEPVKCNAPENLMMGDIVVTSLVYRSRVNYTCGSGYKLSGPSFRECQANATWSFNRPSCLPIVCPIIQNIPHGYVKWTSLRYGASATYECLPGYKIMGNTLRTCEQSGNWAKREPACVSRECDSPPFPENGWVEAENIIVGSVATYYCNDGYELQGSMIRTCLTNESWSLSTPKCIKVKCMPPPDILNGYFNGSSFEFGATVTYSCDEGYSLNGSSVMKCLSTKMWSKSVPTCEPLPCPRPAPPAHGTVLFRTLQVGSIVHFSCKEGYKIHGPVSIACLTNQTWAPSPPVCEIVECPTVKSLKHGKIIGTNVTYEASLTFQCHPKYKLKGADTITCTASGNWSKPAPTCERYLCEDPPAVKNSSVILGPYVVGHMIRYKCNKGYILNGNSNISCDQLGHWQGDLPLCDPVHCGDPPMVKNSIASAVGSGTLGSMITYVCEKGYELKGKAVICSPEGSWTTAPTCEEVHCVDPPEILHASVTVQKKPGITEVVYTCDSGYKLLGLSKHTCYGNDSWSIQSISCELVRCGLPPPIPYGRASAESQLTVGSRVKYHCLPGYRMVGSSVVECSWQGIWDGKPPHCVPVSCGRPEPPEHGTVEGDDFSFENAVLYSCDRGYQIFGRDTRFCLEDGTWSGEEPFCRRISCGEVDARENSYIVYKEAGHFGDTTTFACHDGYRMIGKKEIRCSDTGSWDSEPPICAAVTCPPPTVYPLHAVLMDLNGKTFTVGDRVSFQCEPGFNHQGDLTAECLANSSWTEPKGICKKVSCGRPKISNGAVILGMSYLYKDNVVVLCPPGTKTKGKTILSCKGNGDWNGKPACEGMCPRPCLNGGICIPPGLCSCPSGYVGDVCQHVVCVLPCLNGGTCTGPYSCACLPGFTGTRCQTAIHRRRGRFYRG